MFELKAVGAPMCRQPPQLGRNAVQLLEFHLIIPIDAPSNIIAGSSAQIASMPSG